jgi:hypothetical protein
MKASALSGRAIFQARLLAVGAIAGDGARSTAPATVTHLASAGSCFEGEIEMYGDAAKLQAEVEPGRSSSAGDWAATKPMSLVLEHGTRPRHRRQC